MDKKFITSFHKSQNTFAIKNDRLLSFKKVSFIHLDTCLISWWVKFITIFLTVQVFNRILVSHSAFPFIERKWWPIRRAIERSTRPNWALKTIGTSSTCKSCNPSEIVERKVNVGLVVLCLNALCNGYESVWTSNRWVDQIASWTLAVAMDCFCSNWLPSAFKICTDWIIRRMRSNLLAALSNKMNQITVTSSNCRLAIFSNKRLSPPHHHHRYAIAFASWTRERMTPSVWIRPQNFPFRNFKDAIERLSSDR